MKDWKKFWQNYRLIDIDTENDLLFQVGKTVKGLVISEDQFQKDIDEIRENLNLNSNDVLLDLCCGNGVITLKLSRDVKSVFGIDFSEAFIENAKKYSSSENTTYISLDILDINTFKEFLNNNMINKVLMNDCLAYFNPKTLNEIIKTLSEYDLDILITSILDRERKSNFYNTYKRKWDYAMDVFFQNKKSGIGYWWNASQIIKIGRKHGFESYKFYHHIENHTAHYRFNIKLQKT
jgi:cyclopropane fatty-acyl-phospholipid synthase-like methyltransferase